MKFILSLLITTLLLAGCQKQPTDLVDDTYTEETPCVLGDGSPCDSEMKDTPTPPSPRNLTDVPAEDQTPIKPLQEARLLLIDSVEVLALESYPVQYKAQITGNYRNGCEQISGVEQSVSGNTITLQVKGINFAEICTQALVPFTQSVAIDSTNLKAGEYNLVVNDINTKFNVQ